MADWIDALARQILDSWQDWNQEAEKQAMIDQDEESYDWSMIHAIADLVRQVHLSECGAHPTVQDWRINLTVRPKYRWHRHYDETGVIQIVLPSGTSGIIDTDGILVIKLSGGAVILDGASAWYTA